MEQFRTLIDLIDGISDRIPEGDYTRICEQLLILYEHFIQTCDELDEDDERLIRVEFISACRFGNLEEAKRIHRQHPEIESAISTNLMVDLYAHQQDEVVDWLKELRPEAHHAVYPYIKNWLRQKFPEKRGLLGCLRRN